MQLSLNYDLPFVMLQTSYKGKSIQIPNVLVDTGSASTILSADIVSEIGIVPEPDDILYSIRGVGGSEVVFSRRVNWMQIDQHQVSDFEIEIGLMDYGFEINGILGMDFLLRSGAVVDLKKLSIEFTE